MSSIPSTTITLQANPNSAEAIEFYRRLGMCIASWAYVDRHLYQIFHHAIGFEQKQSAFMFYRNRGFGQRLQIVSDAVKMEASPDLFEGNWKPLHQETRNLSYTRNILAHQPTLRAATSNDGKPLDIYSIFIEPYEKVLNNDYPGLQGKQQLDTSDLVKHEADVASLVSKLSDFAWQMGGLRASKKANRG
jgi:hypothetical protein